MRTSHLRIKEDEVCCLYPMRRTEQGFLREANDLFQRGWYLKQTKYDVRYLQIIWHRW
jgi:hypothetical protein